jgi:uncharacterized protein (DUF2252 family)
VLQAWYDALDLERIIANIPNKKQKRYFRKKLASATGRSDHEKEFARLTYLAGDSPRIIDQPPLIFHYRDSGEKAVLAQAERSLARYFRSLPPERHMLMNRYALVDTAFKVVGVGSVGTVCGIALFLSGNGDPLFIQVKQARPSVLEPYAGASPYTHAGERIVVGQRLMQAAGDIFLGWFTAAGSRPLQYYARQLSDVKLKPVVESMTPTDLRLYARLCGLALARAHARSGDAVVLMGYLGKNDTFEMALADFSLAYADQTERDHAALLEAIRCGLIEARPGE